MILEIIIFVILNGFVISKIKITNNKLDAFIKSLTL